MSAPPGRLRLGLVVTGGGQGVRLGLGSPKQYAPILGVPMIQRTIAALDACSCVDALVVVVNEEDVDYCAGEIVAERFEKVIGVVGGGAERALSVRRGLEALARARPELELLGVHDGARPLVSCEEVERLVQRLSGAAEAGSAEVAGAAAATDSALGRATAGSGQEASADFGPGSGAAEVAGAILAAPSTDTVKLVDPQGVIERTLDRALVWRALTPQVFGRDALLVAYRQDEEVLLAATDDAQLVEKLGHRVAVVPGSAENLKVTTRLDLRLAEQILADRRR